MIKGDESFIELRRNQILRIYDTKLRRKLKMMNFKTKENKVTLNQSQKAKLFENYKY